MLFNGQFLNAQEPFDDFCGTPTDEITDEPGVYSRSIDPSYLLNFEPVSFNYSVILVANGEIQDSKNLLKN